MNEKPKKGGSRPTLHMIDGKQMTVNEIAAMLGVLLAGIIMLTISLAGVGIAG